ncbi:MAG: 50S ribosomal protein L21e [Thermoplasmata archaeon]|nr:MAG: 50S ribosomal protein L21e [Thermoplasmata archaeon]
MKRSRGFRSKSRNKLTKKIRKGASNVITRAMQNFENGEKVAIVIDPSIHHGMPHPRYHGLTGEVVGKQGRAYIIKIRDKRKIKHIIAFPEHLRKVT